MVGGVIPFDNRVLVGVPGVLETAYDILNTCKVVLYIIVYILCS